MGRSGGLEAKRARKMSWVSLKRWTLAVVGLLLVSACALPEPLQPDRIASAAKPALPPNVQPLLLAPVDVDMPSAVRDNLGRVIAVGWIGSRTIESLGAVAVLPSGIEILTHNKAQKALYGDLQIPWSNIRAFEQSGVGYGVRLTFWRPMESGDGIRNSIKIRILGDGQRDAYLQLIDLIKLNTIPSS